MSREFGFEKRQQIMIEQVAENLDSKVKRLIKDLEKVREKIANKDYNYLNSLGEVQGRGQDVDIMCVQIRTMLDSIETYKLHTELDKEG